MIDLLTYVFSTSNGPDQERYFALLQKFLRAACLVRARDGLNVIDEALEKIKKIDDLQVIFSSTDSFNFVGTLNSRKIRNQIDFSKFFAENHEKRFLKTILKVISKMNISKE